MIKIKILNYIKVPKLKLYYIDDYNYNKIKEIEYRI